MRNLNLRLEMVDIRSFINNTLQNAGFEKVILGLSGGIDSAVVATLCKDTLGEKAVLGVMMPYKNSHPDSLKHAKMLAEALKIDFIINPITDMVDAYFKNNADSEIDKLRLGNMMARVRMCILYDLSSKFNALVVGTSNKSEIYAGYCTQYGDSACAFEPIAHLYKTEVTELAKLIKVPADIINKKPTADLWEGQTDEDELGVTYAILDTILFHHLDEKKSKDFILKKGISKHQYDLVIQKIQNSSFKRRMPLTVNS